MFDNAKWRSAREAEEKYHASFSEATRNAGRRISYSTIFLSIVVALYVFSLVGSWLCWW